MVLQFDKDILTVSTSSPFRGWSGRRVALNTHRYLAQELKKEYSNTLLLLRVFMACYRANFTFYNFRCVQDAKNQTRLILLSRTQFR